MTMAMTDAQVAQRLVELAGGTGNIKSVAHCATRLRLVVRDRGLIDTGAIEALDGAKGSFFNSGQYQVIFGTGLVNRIYDETVRVCGTSPAADDGDVEERSYGNVFQRVIRMFADVFVPIIPVLVATGLFMGLRGLLTQEIVLDAFGMTPADVPADLLLFTQILTDTAFAFLPALVCWSAFNNFGGSPAIGIVLGLMLVSPSLPSAYDVGSGAAEPLRFFGFLSVSGYQGSVLPAFVTGFVAARLEQWLHRRIPDAFDLIVTPFLTLLAGILLALFVLGPIMHGLENVVLVAVQAILALPFGLGGLVYGSLGQLLGIFGIHHILNFLEISMLATTGWNLLNPIGSCGNMAQAGSVLAVGVRSRDAKIRQIAFPSALSAMLGITEPAVFGVNLRFVKPYVMALVGGGLGGFIASVTGIKATGMAVTGIPGMLLYLNEMLPIFVLANLSAFACSFALTWLFGYRDDAEAGAEGSVVEAAGTDASPVDALSGMVQAVEGEVLPLSQVPDPVFASGVLGAGMGIVPAGDIVGSPVTGTVTLCYPTGHAVGVTADDGREVLIHIGIDTVTLEGRPFETLVSVGQAVSAGDPLVRFDAGAIREAGLDPTVIVVCPGSVAGPAPAADPDVAAPAGGMAAMA